MEEPKQKNKACQAEAELRVSKILKMLCRGASTAHVIELAREEWGLKTAMIEIYLRRAKEQIKKMVEAQYPTLVQDAVATYDMIIHKALYEGTTKFTKDGDAYTDYDLHAAKAALTDKLKLLGHMRNHVVVTGSLTSEDREEFGEWAPEKLEEHVN